MSTHPADPPSPCIGVCQINPQNGYCEGCFRDENEITAWWGMPAEDKRRLIARLQERRDRIFASLWD